MIASQKKVLVVDDDQTLLELLVDTLKAVGYEAVPAGGGADALDVLTRESFDLMITDVKMPDVDGISLLKRVRRRYPDLPVLFITGVASPEIIASAGPDGFLAKPFRISHVEELIESTLARRSVELRPHTFRRVLVVEGDSHYRETITDTLTLSSFMPFAAPTGAHALRELNNGEFDAVLCDLSLPDMDAFSFQEKVNLESPGLPIIVTGAEDDLTRFKRKAAELEISGYLPKPFKASDMIALLDRVTVTVEAAD
jgi:DNA-binding NtrC family response regulator